ncbi:MAG: OmpA family protein, partial [bacterium]
TGGFGKGVEDTWSVGLSLECLYHLTRWKRFDPYFVVGAGIMVYGEAVVGSDAGYGYGPDWEARYKSDSGSYVDPTLNAGLGMLYHFNDSWALRADARGYANLISEIDANSLINVGIEYTLGAGYPHDIGITGGLVDSDGDGLTDSEEEKFGTDRQKPDTDDDGLNDYDEVKVYGTDPRNPDSDMDLLKDGEEVHHYKTKPSIADSDKGGVGDGHEVLEDGTDPLNPADDFLLYSLEMEFDTDKTDIKPAYFAQLDVIGKVMVRHPASTCVIEGHADKRRSSVAAYNQKLSERRATAVLSYLNKTWKIGVDRMKAKGYGFSRPVAENNSSSGNAKNRRVDIYVDGAKDEAAAPAAGPEAGAVPESAQSPVK